MKIAISAGHGLYVRGASSDMLDEVDEARRVTQRLAEELLDRGVDVRYWWDDVSHTQDENLQRIVDWHNSEFSDLAISVHLNAYEQTSNPRGCEVLYYTQKNLAAKLSAAIAEGGALIDRGAKYSDQLYFLSHTSAPAVLAEICFLDSTSDVEAYKTHFDLIIESLADLVNNEDVVEPNPPAALFEATGKCSFFGGPQDSGVSPSEGLAFFNSVSEAEHLFLPTQPIGTTGLARRLNIWTPYLACRWNYDKTSKEMLAGSDMALVTATKTGISMKAFPADWGPAGPESDHNTGRVTDLSPGLMEALGIQTDDEVRVVYPWRE